MSGPPFRAEHIGSFLRPKAVLAGEDPDPHIEDLIRWQEGLGLRVVTDGEFRRESWRLGFVTKVKGFARADAIGEVDVQHDADGKAVRVGSAPIAVARVERTGPIVADEVAFALQKTSRVVKATMPAPSYLHYPRGDACVDPKVYPDIGEFFDDVTEIYCAEVNALHEVGGSYLQLDEVAQPLLCDDKLRAAVRARGDDPDRLVTLYIDLINRIARRRPVAMTLGVHMCRGNAFGRWIGSGSYDRIAEQTFNTLEADAFFLEYDDERAGGFEPLRFVPAPKRVILGLVSTKTPVLEKKEDLIAKIRAAEKFIPLERLGISPQCGFASHREGSGLSFAQQEAKMRLVVKTARDVWGDA